MQDKPAALREAARVLARGGRIGFNSADADRPHQSAALVREALIEAGLRTAGDASTYGTNYRVNAAELSELLRAAGFENIRIEAHTFGDDIAGVDDLIAWSTSSSFGNFLSDLDPGQRLRIRELLAQELEARRGPQGIQLERYLVFATAEKA